ncbi:MAG: Hsp20/alpha crystallin family protein [Firmicutes bacterium]|nr:Hsp20/alpha crystallin family protein [Bacillota bacterium]
MAQGFDPSGSFGSMADQFRRVFGDDFVQNLMKSINVSEMLGGGSGAADSGSRMSDGAIPGMSGAMPGANGGMPGMPGIPGVPGMPNMQGFPFNMMGAGGAPGGAAAQGATAAPASQSGASASPRLDVVQTRHEVIVWIELPGVEAGDVKISATPEALRVKGNLKRPYTMSSDDQVVHAEMVRGEFVRDVPLPVRVKSEKIRANYRQGMLEVRMLKADPDNAPRGQDVPIRFDGG